jgi:hypothetical protein
MVTDRHKLKFCLRQHTAQQQYFPASKLKSKRVLDSRIEFLYHRIVITTNFAPPSPRYAVKHWAPYSSQFRAKEEVVSPPLHAELEWTPHLLRHSPALGLHIRVRVEVVGLEYLELIRVRPAVNAHSDGRRVHREHAGVAGGPRPRRLGGRHRPSGTLPPRAQASSPARAPSGRSRSFKKWVSRSQGGLASYGCRPVRRLDLRVLIIPGRRKERRTRVRAVVFDGCQRWKAES